MSEELERPTYTRCPRCRQIYPPNSNYCVRDRSPLSPDDRIIVGKYVLLQKIGAGSMSEVYLAEQPALGRQVAVKILHRDPALIRRFDTEVQSIGRIRHDHVVIIHDSGRLDDGRCYLTMEYLEGENLATHLSQHGPMTAERAMVLWRQAVSAIAAAHRLQMVHRDIKPANLILTNKEGDEGPEEIVKVIDFGLAKQQTPDSVSTTNPGAVVGTMLYMAPEQLKSGQASLASDVYSLGLLLIEMLTGRLPFAAGPGDPASVDAALRRLVLSPSRLHDTSQKPPSEDLLQLASAVLHPDAMQRPPDAGELLRRIKRLPEMQAWTRLPRKLPPSRTSFSDLSWLKYSPSTANPPDGAMPDPSGVAQDKGDDSSWKKLQEEAEDPTLPPKAESPEERSMQAIMLELSAETRLEPVESLPSMHVVEALEADAATKGDDDDEDDADATDPISALPTTELDPPTRPGTPPVESDDFPTVQEKTAPETDAPQPVVVPVLAQDTGPTAIGIPRPRETSRTVLFAGSCVVVGLLLLLLVRMTLQTTPATTTKQPVTPETAAVADLAIATNHDAPRDLGVPRDLAATRDAAPAAAAPAAMPAAEQADESIRVRFYFDDEDDVNEITCGPRTLFQRDENTKKKVSIDTDLLPSESCRASNAEGNKSKVFRYAQLESKRPDRTGARRVHIKLKSKSSESE